MSRLQSYPVNHYPDGPYLNTLCKHCGVEVRHTGSTSGITWTEAALPNIDGWTCFKNIKGRGFGQHDPREIITEAEIAVAVQSIKESA